MSRVDLSEADVVDSHTHPYRLQELLDRDPGELETRITFAGESFFSSSKLDASLWPFVHELSESTMLALALRRWLAGYLGCDPTPEAVSAAREAALRKDPVAYTRGLLEDERVVAVLSDEGFPQPPISAEDFSATIGSKVYRVARLEPWILDHRGGTFDELVQGVEHEAQKAADDPNCVAYKSIIAYRTGLDVGEPSAQAAGQAFDDWRAADWVESREHSKLVRDFCLQRALAVAKANDRPFHIHCGAGDPDIDLQHAGPANLWPLLVSHTDQAVVLIHSGFPWIADAAYIASVLPHVYLEISELVPWGWSMVEPALELMLGTAPAAKVLHGSDEAGEPEMFWVAAKLVRACLERVLGGFVERDYVTEQQAGSFGHMVLGGNSRRLHGLD